jgi:hypothetical protein
MCAEYLPQDVSPEQRLMAAINRLARVNGKLEIKFMNSDNERTEKVCLVFIKLPLSTTIESIVRDKIKTSNKVPLSVGRLSVEHGDHITVLTGIIRVKSIDKLGNVVYGIVDRMLNILSTIINNKYDYNSI